MQTITSQVRTVSARAASYWHAAPSAMSILEYPSLHSERPEHSQPIKFLTFWKKKNIDWINLTKQSDDLVLSCLCICHFSMTSSNTVFTSFQGDQQTWARQASIATRFLTIFEELSNIGFSFAHLFIPHAALPNKHAFFSFLLATVFSCIYSIAESHSFISINQHEQALDLSHNPFQILFFSHPVHTPL